MSICGIILLIAAAVFIYIYNSLVIKRVRVENFAAYVNGFFKRRVEILTELLHLLPEHDSKEFLQVQALVDSYPVNAALEEKSIHDKVLTTAWKALHSQLAAAGNTPDPEVKKILERIERNGGYLATVRQEYNKAVSNLNNEIKVFPWSALAKKMKISPRTPLEIPQDEWYKPLKLSNFRD